MIRMEIDEIEKIENNRENQWNKNLYLWEWKKSNKLKRKKKEGGRERGREKRTTHPSQHMQKLSQNEP